MSEWNIIEEKKSARLRYLGHMERIGGEGATKRSYLGPLKDRRPVGQPRYRWKAEVAKDLKELNVLK